MAQRPVGIARSEINSKVKVNYIEEKPELSCYIVN